MKNNSTWIVRGAFALLGAVAGYFYWKHFGCTSNCTISSKPLNSMIYFSMIGVLAGNIFKYKGKASGK